METNDSYVELFRELFEQLARMRRGMHPSARNSMRGEMAVIRALHLAAVAGEADPTPSQIAKRSHLSPAREALRILKRCNEILSKQDPTETKGGDADENHQAL